MRKDTIDNMPTGSYSFSPSPSWGMTEYPKYGERGTLNEAVSSQSGSTLCLCGRPWGTGKHSGRGFKHDRVSYGSTREITDSLTVRYGPLLITYDSKKRVKMKERVPGVLGARECTREVVREA